MNHYQFLQKPDPARLIITLNINLIVSKKTHKPKTNLHAAISFEKEFSFYEDHYADVNVGIKWCACERARKREREPEITRVYDVKTKLKGEKEKKERKRKKARRKDEISSTPSSARSFLRTLLFSLLSLRRVSLV